MEKIVINGGNKLHGSVSISGAKNSVVAILPATLLAEGTCRIENVPDIKDVTVMLRILSDMGAEIKTINKNTYEINTKNITSNVVKHEMSRQLRASYYFIGALLGRFNHARVAMPGGCSFGVRPIDQHIKGFEALGAKVVMGEKAMVDVKADKLIGTSIYFDVVTVGATINIMLASCKAKGLTIIENAAKEPHIVDLANFLNSMGADIRGAGTETIKIRGMERFHGCEYSIIPDQIEAGTYMVATAATRGDVLIKNVIPKHLESISAKLIECGAVVEDFDDSIHVSMNRRPNHISIKTMPHPGFPTDMQPQISTLLSLASGSSIISESVWDNRFRYVEQLIRMGANIRVDGKSATIQGVEVLHGAPVRADDLRAGAAMIIAGLIAKGTTEIEEIYHIQRGYDHIIDKLKSIGADIELRNDPDNSDQISNAG